jgi:hypothetical protein
MKRILKWIVRVVFILLVLAFLFVLVAYWRSTNDCGKTAAPTNPMKAIVYCDYGVANLKLEEVEKPTPTDEQLLVRVHAASVNPLDWHFIEGTPYVLRAMGGGLRKPKETRLGVDFAGTVEAVGKSVTQFKVGDEVFGGRDGAFAEYVCPRADRAITLKPAGITFEQAASVPIAGITALQGLRDDVDLSLFDSNSFLLKKFSAAVAQLSLSAGNPSTLRPPVARIACISNERTGNGVCTRPCVLSFRRD